MQEPVKKKRDLLNCLVEMIFTLKMIEDHFLWDFIELYKTHIVVSGDSLTGNMILFFQE